MKKNRVMFIINNLGIGGAERLVVDDINEMLVRGVDVFLVTLKQEKKDSFIFECGIEKNKHVLVEFSGLFDIRSWYKIINLIKIINPDIIFTHLWLSNFVGRIATFFSRRKNIYSFEHNLLKVKTYKTIFIDFFLQFFCKKIIAVSSAVKDDLIKVGIMESKIILLLNCIDIDKYKNAKALSKQTFNLKEDDFVFVSIGRLVYQKGFDILIKAFLRIGDKAHLFIIGDGHLKDELINLSKSSKNIHFLGLRKDVAQMLKMSDCFVLSSRWEGLGIVIMEAMASRRPVIITNFKAGLDIVEDGINGFVVENGNIDQLFSKMLSIIDGKIDSNIFYNIDKKINDFSIKNHVNYLLNLI